MQWRATRETTELSTIRKRIDENDSPQRIILREREDAPRNLLPKQSGIPIPRRILDSGLLKSESVEIEDFVFRPVRSLDLASGRFDSGDGAIELRDELMEEGADEGIIGFFGKKSCADVERLNGERNIDMTASRASAIKFGSKDRGAKIGKRREGRKEETTNLR